MHYPRVVYHPEFDKNAPEKEREKKSKVVWSEKDHMERYPEWGEHPEVLKQQKDEEKKVVVRRKRVEP